MATGTHKKSKRKRHSHFLRKLCIVASIVLALNLFVTIQSYSLIDGSDHGEFKNKTPRAKITIESLSDLGDLDLYGYNNNNQSLKRTMTLEEASKGKEPLLQLLRDAGVVGISIDVINLLPLWSQVEQIYGNKGPIIEGLSQCETFRKSFGEGQQHSSLGIAGMFDSGTNLASAYLEANCKLSPSTTAMKDGFNSRIRWQVPWGKHMLAKKRKDHLVVSKKSDKGSTDPASVLPIVLIRDPYYWMQSLCRHNYGAQWLRDGNGGHCPNLVPNDVDYKIYKFPSGTIPVRIKYDYGVERWLSLPHLWTDWYTQYYRDADYPRLVVRFEDFLFYPKQVTQRICECVGGTLLRDDFYYAVDSAKDGPGHGSARTSLVSAMIRYGSGVRRFHNMTDKDLSLARDVLDAKLMETFHYAPPSV